eukprot:1248235-Pleurochrysis_carterae.AAC.1
MSKVAHAARPASSITTNAGVAVAAYQSQPAWAAHTKCLGTNTGLEVMHPLSSINVAKTP